VSFWLASAVALPPSLPPELAVDALWSAVELLPDFAFFPLLPFEVAFGGGIEDADAELSGVVVLPDAFASEAVPDVLPEGGGVPAPASAGGADPSAGLLESWVLPDCAPEAPELLASDAGGVAGGLAVCDEFCDAF
jgi:hypothetical protein